MFKKTQKCTNLDYKNDYFALVESSNPYGYNFGRSKEHIHTDVFSRFQNRFNEEYYRNR